jgi:hypothetical protein
MKNIIRSSTAAILVLATSMLLTMPAAFASGPKPKQMTNASAAVRSVAPSRKQTVGGFINGLLGVQVFQQPRSYAASAAIIGGSAATGAVVGGLLKGKKGAIIGAIAGGTAGFIYDHKTSHRGSLLHF